MVNYLERMGARLLGRVLPTATAAAAVPCCGDACGYEYRCVAPGLYQRRFCCSDCQCKKSCGGWQTIARGC